VSDREGGIRAAHCVDRGALGQGVEDHRDGDPGPAGAERAAGDVGPADEVVAPVRHAPLYSSNAALLGEAPCSR
jgi:hypothetical protein